MVMFVFSFLDLKSPFRTNLVEKKLSIQFKIWYLQNIKDVEFDDDVHFFCFIPEKHILGKFGPKAQSCLLKVNFHI